MRKAEFRARSKIRLTVIFRDSGCTLNYRRKKMNKYIILIFPVLLFAGFLYAVDDKSGLVTGKCDTCHSIDKICKNIGKKDSSAWEKTIDRMIKKGAKVSGDEKKEILAYLPGLEPGTNPICK